MEALTSLEKLEEEIEKTITLKEDIDNCVLELDKMVKRLSAVKIIQPSKDETLLESAPSNKQIQDS